MKSSINAALAAVTTIILFVFPSCSKVLDFLHHNPGQENKLCNIQQLMANANPVVTFHYNTAGNPVDMLTTYSSTGSDVIYQFRYDSHDRLIAFDLRELKSSSDTIRINTDRYSYPDKKTIVDTLYIFNELMAPFRITTYTLDTRGRVIKSVSRQPAPNLPVITDYVYDSNGNLERPGVIYDDKVNLFRTNSIWQFIFLDYSENNPSSFGSIISYDSFGLPTHIEGGGYLFDNNFGILTISYSCDAGQAK